MQQRKFLGRFLEDAALAPRLRLLRLAGKLLVPSCRFKWPQLDWWKNEEFTRYLDRFGELGVLNTGRKDDASALKAGCSLAGRYS